MRTEERGRDGAGFLLRSHSSKQVARECGGLDWYSKGGEKQENLSILQQCQCQFEKDGMRMHTSTVSV